MVQKSERPHCWIVALTPLLSLDLLMVWHRKLDTGCLTFQMFCIVLEDDDLLAPFFSFPPFSDPSKHHHATSPTAPPPPLPSHRNKQTEVRQIKQVLKIPVIPLHHIRCPLMALTKFITKFSLWGPNVIYIYPWYICNRKREVTYTSLLQLSPSL